MTMMNPVRFTPRARRWRLGALVLAALTLAVFNLRTLPTAAEDKKAAAEVAVAQKIAIALGGDMTRGSKQPGTLPAGPIKVTGKVLNPDKKPVADAKVAVVSLSSGDGAARDPKVLGQTTTDAKGHFELKAKNPDAARPVVTLVSAKGHSLAWHFAQPGPEPVLRVQPEQVLRGRLIDLQGQPAAGVKVQVCRLGIVPPSQPGFIRVRQLKKAIDAVIVNKGGQMMMPGDQAKDAQPPALRLVDPPAGMPFWPQATTTDKEGRFTLRGMPQGQGVGLLIRDSRFAVQALNVKPQKGAKPAAVTLVLEQVRTLEGMVTDADTGKPLPHARLHIPSRGNGYGFVSFAGANTGDIDWRGRRTNGNQTFAFFLDAFGASADELPALDVRADKRGRYKIPLFLAGSYSVEVSAPAGEPYLPTTRTVGWARASARQELNLALTRGVLVKGKVTETPSGKAVAGARIDYWAPGLKMPQGVRFPEFQTSGADGKFQILLPPGSWQLVVNSPTGNFVRQKVEAAKLTGEQPLRISTPTGAVVSTGPDDKKQFVHPDGWVTLNLKPRSDTQQADIKLQRVTLKGKVVGPDGKPMGKAVMFYRHPMPVYPKVEKEGDAQRLTRLAFFGPPPGPDEPALAPVQVRDGKFELPLRDLKAGYQIYFLDAKSKLAAVAEVSGKDTAPTVKLTACGSAKAHFLDAKGEPKAKYQPRVWLLLPPGPHPTGGQPAFAGAGLGLKRVRVVVAGRAPMWDLARNSSPPNHDRIALGQADALHYGKEFATDAKGNITFPALIPGATYRIVFPDGKVKDFKAEAGKTVDLKDITVPDAPKAAVLPQPRLRRPIKIQPAKPLPKKE
jgi:protocatechuate 3,4-dioxygenase beta subunit